EGKRAVERGQVRGDYTIPSGTKLVWPAGEMTLGYEFLVHSAAEPLSLHTQGNTIDLPSSAIRVVPGSSWGMFTIACTIPIALYVGLYMYKIRPGKVVEASVIGGLLTIGATVLGGVVAETGIGRVLFN